jgi:large subunit ribosomal protein L21
LKWSNVVNEGSEIFFGVAWPGAEVPFGPILLTLTWISFTKSSGKTMRYAVIRTGGKQYRVTEGDLVRIEKLAGEVGEKITLGDVLFIGGNGDAKIGLPLVENASVTGEIVSQAKAKKVLVFKKKRRKSYSRQRGHRQHQTTLRITGIDG